MEQDEKREKRSEDLFPPKSSYTLRNGEVVRVEPWSIETLDIMLRRIPKVAESVMDGDPTQKVTALLPTALDEIKFMVAHTVGWSEDELKANCTADDLLGLATVVWEVCLQGTAEKALGLVGQMKTIFGQPSASSSSSKPSSS